MRTCVGCRRRETQSHLLRMVRELSAAGDTAAVADPRHRLPGRGAWLHPTTACLALALKRRAIGRALPGASDCTAVADYVALVAGAASAENEESNCPT
ncbi:YlxR family protein [Paenarthrobacter sp. Z7-10]|uniref:YlxR family protein n=1 Tax=Paenarthrobacter sp. Z7-10 TaxID=2787635 RepID=UPI002E785DB1|nr:YlxR family protein [Paenarthrobacter sp. Z7-10]MCZ2403612.1 YlxR family protein [Paenarthrobacter sp. Z7-10]